jgi:hypothetical protein
MSSNTRDARIEDSAQRSQPGLDPDELRAEQAGELPERDAMSIISVGGLEGGLPPADLLDDVLQSDVPVETLPVDGLPVELYPIDRLPVDRLPIDPLPPGETPPIHPLPVEPPVDTLPVEPPGDTLPIDPPVVGDPIGIPDLPEATADASVKV